ncbi:hypothetical protein ACFHWD_16915 [Clostridium sp. MT-14]|jgi:hypothetical protein|uniref:hypothetical protein n=1 Tax=Clostridium sp. MT-14 TaxID=3348360 RepID=UPI0035F2C352
MREIKLGDKEVKIRATPLALLFYKQEFKSDLIGSIVALEKVKDDISKIDLLSVLQMTWAMAKAEQFNDKKSFPSFEAWLSGFENVDFTDQNFLVAVMEEATDGFFHGARAKFPKSAKSK